MFSGAIILSSVPAGNIQKADTAGNYIFNAKIPAIANKNIIIPATGNVV